jgi:hypothetical protein
MHLRAKKSGLVVYGAAGEDMMYYGEERIREGFPRGFPFGRVKEIGGEPLVQLRSPRVLPMPGRGSGHDRGDAPGYEPEEFLGDGTFWANHIHPDDEKRVLEETGQLLEKGRVTCEYRFQHKDGTYR